MKSSQSVCVRCTRNIKYFIQNHFSGTILPFLSGNHIYNTVKIVVRLRLLCPRPSSRLRAPAFIARLGVLAVRPHEAPLCTFSCRIKEYLGASGKLPGHHAACGDGVA